MINHHTRTPLVAGNWKMNMLAQSARELVEGIKAANLDAIANVEKLLCPPFVYLPLVAQLAHGTTLHVGGQDLHWEEKGAFTGAVSAPMLRDYATHVIIGHSERRAMFGDTDEVVNKKLKAAIMHGLTPIVCVGETGEQRNAGRTRDVLRDQVLYAVEGIDLPPSAVIAYEPVWAIGTGVAATVADANDAIGFIREQVSRLQGSVVGDAVRILYGGSVTPANIAEFVAQPEVDGGLVGGAALVADSYVEMVRNVAAISR
jgi:triosephosphate isomerase